MTPEQRLESIPLDEIVTIIMPGELKMAATVAQAVRRVMSWKDKKVQKLAWLQRQGRESLNYEDIAAIYARSDFHD